MHGDAPPAAFLRDNIADWIVPETRPCGSRTIDQSRPAISQARKPAFIESNTIARSRSGDDDERETWRNMRFSIGGVTPLACLPGMAEILLSCGTRRGERRRWRGGALCALILRGELRMAAVAAGRSIQASEAAKQSTGVQYSSASMIVMTRVVTAGLAGSGDPNSVLRS